MTSSWRPHVSYIANGATIDGRTTPGTKSSAVIVLMAVLTKHYRLGTRGVNHSLKSGYPICTWKPLITWQLFLTYLFFPKGGGFDDTWMDYWNRSPRTDVSRWWVPLTSLVLHLLENNGCYRVEVHKHLLRYIYTYIYIYISLARYRV